MTTVPTPAILADSAPRTRSRHAEEHSCLRKNRYETEALALDAAARRMLVGAHRPLRVYPCDYCFGFHLTSSDSGADSVAVPPVLGEADPQAMLKAHHGKGRRRARHEQNHDHAKEQQEPIDLLPEPHVASPEETAAFFARHQRSA